ncbi:hypothetical protein AVENLUH7437_03454 [Acinetobacter venetianus]|nr:hypothetical protein AVENLUH7437_03454 [Acinetobacter venetianus]
MRKQYSKNLIIQQISSTEFLLQVTDCKLAEELRLRLPSIFGRYISKPKLIMSDKVQESHFTVSGMDSESFYRHLETLSPKHLDSLSSH